MGISSSFPTFPSFPSSSSSSSRILYIGANSHLTPLEDFENASFVMLDSLPNNEYGFDVCSNHCNGSLRFWKHLQDQYPYQPTRLWKDKKFLPERVQFTDRLVYHFSTPFPNCVHVGEVLNDIQSCDTLLISGHYPDMKVFSYLPERFHFIGYSKTYFPSPDDVGNVDDNDESITHTLQVFMSTLNTLKPRVLSFTWVDFDSGVKRTFSTYREFWEHHMRSKMK